MNGFKMLGKGDEMTTVRSDGFKSPASDASFLSAIGGAVVDDTVRVAGITAAAGLLPFVVTDTFWISRSYSSFSNAKFCSCTSREGRTVSSTLMFPALA